MIGRVPPSRVVQSFSHFTAAEFLSLPGVPLTFGEWSGKVPSVTVCGNLEILRQPRIALFCSIRCPGDAILRACDMARQWRDENRCIISGFHSPVERECLRILMRGTQPVIICPARDVAGMRVPPEWKEPLQQGRLMVSSPFQAGRRRASAAQAEVRNEFVLALAHEVWFAHVASGGHIAKLAQRAAEWGKRLWNPTTTIGVQNSNG